MKCALASAFRGDLTKAWRAKNPDVEPANELLKRIRVERRARWEAAELEKLKAKGKAPKDDGWKSKYEEPAAVDTAGLPALPAGWCWASLAALTDPVRLIRYGMLMPGDDVPGGVPYVKVKHMRGDNIVPLAELPRTTQAMSDQFAGALLAKGDLLLSIRGTYGRIALVADELDGVNITQDSARVAPMPGVDRGYLAAVLRSPYAQRYFDDIAKGVAVRGINIGDIRPMPVPLAPITEQHAIALASEQACKAIAAIAAEVGGVAARHTTLDASILAKAFRGELVVESGVMSLEERRAALDPFDAEGAIELARAWIEERGDLPEHMAYELSFVQHEPGQMSNRIAELRAEIFAKRGQQPPPYSGMLE